MIRVGDRDLVVSAGAFHAAAYDPQNGKEVWRVDYPEGFSNVPRPVYGAGLVFIATGFQQPSILAVRPHGKGNVTRSHIAWTLSRGAPLTPSPLLVGDDLYLVTDAGIASNVDARTGAIRWQHRLGASGLGLTGLRRRTCLLPGRRGENDGYHSRADVSTGCDQLARRGGARINGRRVAIVLHPNGYTPVSNWQVS